MATLTVTSSSDPNLSGKLSRACVHCGSEEIYRRHPRGLIERHLRRVSHLTPYWCAGCDRHFYLRAHKSPGHLRSCNM